MANTVNFSYTNAALSSKVALPFGLAVASQFDLARLKRKTDQMKTHLIESLEENQSRILANIELFDKFFKANGYKCPLRHQFNGVLIKGPPSINPVIDALLMCEMTTGLLMGVQDSERIEGDLRFDVLDKGESYRGMRVPIQCRKGEIVLRDTKGIIASLFQGPDKRTEVTASTSSLAFFVFWAPGLSQDAFDSAISTVDDVITSASENRTVNKFTPPLSPRVDQNPTA